MDRRITPAELANARTLIRRSVLAVWQPFLYTFGGWQYHYRFVFQVLASRQMTPVQTITSVMNDDVPQEAESEGLFRDGRSAIQEAHQFGFDNIAIVSANIVGRPHGVSISAVAGGPYTRSRPDMAMQSQLNATGDLLDAAPNGMVLHYSRDVATGGHTAAHETGHLLGLDNEPHDLASIMGPWANAAQDRARRVTPKVQRLLHAVIESNVPGFTRPSEAQTIAPATPFHVEGTYSRADP